MLKSDKGVLLKKIQRVLHQRKLKGLEALVQRYFLIINKAMKGRN